MEETFIAWAAGFFDGEGTVIVTNTAQVHTTNTPLWVTVTQMDRNPLDKLMESFGGYICISKGKHFTWKASNSRAVAFLRAVRPYLLVKAEEADIALAWPLGNWHGPLRPMPAEVRAKRLEIQAALRKSRVDRRVAATENMKIYRPSRSKFRKVEADGVEYASITEAAQAIGVSMGGLRQRLIRNKTSCGGHSVRFI